MAVKEKSKRVTIEPCDKLLDGFFSGFNSVKGLDKQTTQILKDLYQKNQFTADNIIRELKNVRLNLHE